MEKNTGKVREKSGNFVSPEKWEPWICRELEPEASRGSWHKNYEHFMIKSTLQKYTSYLNLYYIQWRHVSFTILWSVRLTSSTVLGEISVPRRYKKIKRCGCRVDVHCPPVASPSVTCSTVSVWECHILVLILRTEIFVTYYVSQLGVFSILALVGSYFAPFSVRCVLFFAETKPNCLVDQVLLRERITKGEKSVKLNFDVQFEKWR